MSRVPKSAVYWRFIHMLMSGAKSVMALQIGAGCTHAPSVRRALRAYGLEIPSRLVEVFNRDGDRVRAGEYSMTTADRKLVRSWLKK